MHGLLGSRPHGLRRLQGFGRLDAADSPPAPWPRLARPRHRYRPSSPARAGTRPYPGERRSSRSRRSSSCRSASAALAQGLPRFAAGNAFQREAGHVRVILVGQQAGQQPAPKPPCRRSSACGKRSPWHRARCRSCRAASSRVSRSLRASGVAVRGRRGFFDRSQQGMIGAPVVFLQCFKSFIQHIDESLFRR